MRKVDCVKMLSVFKHAPLLQYLAGRYTLFWAALSFQVRKTEQ